MNSNIRWSSPKQISFSKKDAANALSRSFLVNIYRTLSLSTVLSPIEKRFVQETFTLFEYYICSLNVLYTNSVIRAVAKKKLVTEAMSMKNFLYIFAKHFDRDKY